MPPLPLPGLETGRLLLRPFRTSDHPAYRAWHSRPEVYRFLYMPVPDATTLDRQFAEACNPRFETEGDTLRLAVTRRADGAVLGEVLLKIISTGALQAETGYIFHPDHAGAGYATEAVARLLDYGFEGCGFHRIFARLDPLNTGSLGVVERLGLRREAHLRQNDRFNGTWGDEYIYALLRPEWAARHSSGSSAPL